MSYYDTFLSVNKSPKEFYLNQIQELVNGQFDNASTVQSDVEEEIEFGTLSFVPCESRITSLIDVKTGKKNNDDFKKILFRDVTHQPPLGTRYRFEDNIWIAYATDNIKSATSSAYLQRCNCTMNSQDKYGNIHEEPCYVDYNLMETQLLTNIQLDVPAGRIEVKCQLNKYTKDVDVNARFIFGDDVYKLRSRSKPNRLNTFDKDSVTFLSFYANYDNKAEDDNFDLTVANYKTYNYVISCQSNIKNTIGAKDTLKSTVYLDGIEIEEDVLWYSSDASIIEINEVTGEYTLVGLGICNVTCKLKNNIIFNTSIKVEVVDVIIDSYHDAILPNITYVKLNQKQTYEVFEYNNGIPTDTTFTINSYDVPDKNYHIDTTLNGFSITNLKSTKDVLLRIVCKNNRTSELNTLLIELGGLF